MCVSELQIGFSVTPDWLRKWHKIFESINEHVIWCDVMWCDEIGVQDDYKATNDDDDDWVNTERNKNLSGAN